MISIPAKENWRKVVSRGKYPMLLLSELKEGLKNTHLAIGTKTRLKSYCRFTGASYLYELEAKKLIKELKIILEKKPKLTLTWLEGHYALIKSFKQWAGDLRKIESRPRDFNLEKLKRLFYTYEKYAQTFWRWAYYNFLLDEVIYEKVIRLLDKQGVKPADQPGLVKILTCSRELTLHQREQEELSKLASRIKHMGQAAAEDKIKKHAVKWGWKNNWIYHYERLTSNDFKKEIKTLFRGDPEKELKTLHRNKQDGLKEKTKWLKNFDNRQLKLMSEILSAYAYWHSLKMEEITRIIYLAQPLLRALAGKINLSYDEFLELTPEEIKLNKINKETIKSRLKDNGILLFNNQVKILTGRTLKAIRNNFLSKAQASDLVKGYGACAGKAKGQVIIVTTDTVLTKIKFPLGGILVTAMTTVNMTNLIKRAAAVVTDEGGILSHAAIISRELEKPCVIGTKIATQVLHSGDYVEVDAERGFVKILKK
jgi:phosphohistidine swiveling domain-containing protein